MCGDIHLHSPEHVQGQIYIFISFRALESRVIAAMIPVRTAAECRVNFPYISMMVECGAPKRAETSGGRVA